MGLLTLIVVGVMFYSSYTGQNMAERYAPLVDATIEIKLEATTAHLWFEEIISGDRFIAIEDVWNHLDQAEWYARAMLEGGESPEGKLVSLGDPALRQKIEQTLKGITDFRGIAQERWKVKSQSGIGSNIDQRFDKTFNDFIVSADDVETTLQQTIETQLQRFRLVQNLLVIIVLLAGLLITAVLKRHDRRRTNYIRRLQQREGELHAKEAHLRTLAAVIFSSPKTFFYTSCTIQYGHAVEKLSGFLFYIHYLSILGRLKATS